MRRAATRLQDKRQADKWCVKSCLYIIIIFFSIGKSTSSTHASDYSADGPWIFGLENALVRKQILQALAASCVQSRQFFASILYTLSMRVRNWCMHWACASGTDAYAEHAHQELMRTLSMRIRNWCVRWACASGTYACAEHTSQELVACTEHTCKEHSPFKTCWAYASATGLTLSMRARNGCVCWAYTSETIAYPEHTHQFLTRVLTISKNSKFEKVSSNHVDHARKKLMRVLSMHVRKWCVHWAYVSDRNWCTR